MYERNQSRHASDYNVDPQSKKARKSNPNAPFLCLLCTIMFSHRGLQDLNSSAGFRHQTRTECQASRLQGCKMCEYIYYVVCVKERHDKDWKSEHRLIFHNFRNSHSSKTASDDQLLGIYGLRGSFASEPDKSIITIYTFAEQENPISAIVHRRPLHRDVRSESVFAAATSLIRKCMNPKKPHRHCQYSRDTVLPTRVLDLGDPREPSAAIKLKVNETEVHAPYLALSYCWGKQDEAVKPCLLQRNNLRDFIDGIELQTQQQSIQDAIFVTRALGFRHLWVDALCIVQDCKDDKEREISRMASIYKNAAITISAASSKQAVDGFLSDRITPYLPDHMIDIPMSAGKEGTVYLSCEAYAPEHPLDSRGWALQEFMLSSRMLIFSDYELLWKCAEVDLCSVTGSGLEYLLLQESLPWAVFDDDTESHYGSLDSEKIYLWKTIVQEYTERQLTNPEDRLPAVMGITIELEMLWRDVNIYGLWKKWFIELLAWFKPDVERESERNLTRAPSWSWACLNGFIRHETPFTTQDAKVKSVTVTSVELTCRVLKDDEISHGHHSDSILERPDLIDPTPELQQRGLHLKEPEYLLLGINEMGGVKRGIGLLVMDAGERLYRRIGLAIFTDMTVWDNVEPQDIFLEPRIA